MLVYEFPLNEKSRTYLRFNTLFEQLDASRHVTQTSEALAFFKSLFDFIELSERCDIRTDLMKDLEKQRQKIELWRQLPEVDHAKLDALQQELGELIYQLPRSVRAGSCFKEDKFLCAIRQRFSIPGGLCSFDVPILHHWLGLPIAQRQQATSQWCDEVQLLRQATRRLLQLWRESSYFTPQLARNGFFQENADGAEMVRLRLEQEQGHYPTVSGHKSRFAIRFLPLGELETGDIQFELAIA